MTITIRILLNTIIYSGACSIPFDDSVILTGGYKSYKVEENESWSVGDTLTTVSEYNTGGFVRDLPDLLVQRAYHALGLERNTETEGNNHF